MKIYLSHSSSFDYQQELYLPLQTGLFLEKYKLIYPHQESAAPYPTQALFKSSECAAVLAEVSHPSTGQGIELAWAQALCIPIFCFHREGSSPSGALNALDLKSTSYQQIEGIIEKIKIFVLELA